MRLIINTASTFKGGGLQVAKSFIEECKKVPTHDYYVIMSGPLSLTINVNEFPKNFTFFNAPFRPATRIFSLKSHNKFFKKIEKEWKPDVVFTTSGPSYWKPKAPHLIGYNIPHYVYSKSPYFKNIPFKKKVWWKGMKFFAYLNFKYQADAFVVQTDDVNKRLRKFIQTSKVFTVYNTINSYYINPIKVNVKLPFKNNEEFRLLTLSAWYPHKNIGIISKVIHFLRLKGISNVKFILTLADKDFQNAFSQDYSEIINIGPIKVEESPSLYNECDAMFLPTLLECFSASYVEAMKMNKAIVTSDLGFAHTICNTAALYFDPMNPEDIANKIILLMNSHRLKEQLIENGTERLKVFGSADARAKKFLEICKSLLKEAL